MIFLEQSEKIHIKRVVKTHSLLPDTYYVGAMDLEETGVFLWVDGSTVDVPWRSKNGGIAAAAVEEIKNAACGYLNGATGAWQAMYCSEPNFFICQRPL